ncbi:MAG TPA: CARDB domain-containing protein, partial [Candidatus Thermoplasmatota archaeon]|nr:CARDB domain-containing protein [Candidatus Thermoplasmatota archaeon]
MPQHARGASIAVALLTLLPGALASHDPAKPLEVHRPDLFPASLRFGGTDERAPTSVCMEVYNLAPANQGIAGFFDVQLRVEHVLNGSAYFWKEEYRRTSEPLAGGQDVTLCWTFDLPAGTYRASAVVDVANEVEEEREDNNAHPRPYYVTVASRPKPNLVPAVRSFLVGPGDGANGHPQYFQLRVLNLGSAPSVATAVEFRDDAGVIGRADLRALQVSDFAEIYLEADPTRRAPGEYLAVAILDPDGLVDEQNERDNVVNRTYVLAPRPMPDLVVRDLRVNGTLVERRALRLEAVVGNEGNKSLGTTRFRLDIDGVPVANQTLDRLTAGASQTLVFPFYLTSGNHTVRLVADPDFAIPESNETNNDLAVLVAVDAIPIALRYANL